MPGDEVVDDADAMSAPDELFGQVGADEAGAAGHEIVRHGAILDRARVRDPVPGSVPGKNSGHGVQASRIPDPASRIPDAGSVSINRVIFVATRRA